MRLAFYILLTTGLVFFGCKKEATKPVSGSLKTSCVCLDENIGVGPGNQIACNGFLTIYTYTDATVGKESSHMNVMAYFNDKASTQVNGNFVTVDSVLLDEQHVDLLYGANNEPMYYFMSSNGAEQQRWSVYGDNGIPTFTYTAHLKDPYADFSMVPDQINKSSQQAFSLDSVKNSTGATASISDESGKTYWNISVIIREGSNRVCFPEDQLKMLGPGKARLMIILENTEVQTFNSKNMAFEKKLQYEKEIILNP
jgi:hypothetical protein